MPLNKNTQTKPEKEKAEEVAADEQAPEQSVAEDPVDKAPEDGTAAETTEGEPDEATGGTPAADDTPKAARGKGKKAVFMSVHRMMRDPDTGLTYHTNRITEGRMPRKGSWLDCQMQADLIRKVKVG